ncbi:efflux RND transporter permease subunit [Methylococcus capsulatus]|uniref:efflux RND transporter permease subunit n=1 Tax=Methylococcus capsulatus TaxID=414 RepID=UPI001C528F09|nr:efflux RND transporter permease subunit [Methylococcus capsulatus]QXP86332.1 efflux RND transporter permease subunit [Methylococcus capsulatus]QXP89450.1 efflux RND transporter permease subunit [Methylococcus capsulatus]QXP93997.1 efflux RND transporter permease subunit [Methylococcus capsulatus]UQN11268.1 efflux RND transporter permease subunit [Methylococcus capsulatus]
MNQIVLIALRRPYTFVVLSILIVLFGILSVLKTATDVFPPIKIPVVSVVWSYAGLLPQDVSGRITYYYERALTSTVEGIARIESNSYYGISIINIYLQPDTNLAGAEAEITAISQTVVKQLPPDISPPLIMRLEASSVPVAMLQVTSDTLSPSELYNLAYARIRTLLVTIPGAILPQPYGGKPQQLLVSLDKQKLLAHNITATDVHNAFGDQSIVLPAGDMKIKQTDWMVQTNATPMQIEDFNNIPIKRVDATNSTIYLRDVADVQIAGPPQINAVLVEGKQAVMIVVMKSGNASTLDVVDGIKKMIPRIEQIVPEGVKIKLLNDASIFVKDSIKDVLHEMGTAALLTGLVVLLFLGSWRPTVIIATSIPLAILTSLICLHLLGESINIMTLGGLALAVGILVDDATVMIENIDTHLEMGKPLETAIIDAANQIVVPTLVATLCIVTVWFPLFELSGVSGYLFAPMAEAVIFAMLASFILSRTLVPTMAKYVLVAHDAPHSAHHAAQPPGFLSRFQQGFERGFDRFRENYKARLEQAIAHRGAFIRTFLAFAVGSLVLYYFNGRDFFPEIKSGTIQMHMRAPLGTRIEVAGRIASLVSNDIANLLPGQVEGVVSNCGLPIGPHNLAFIPTPTIGSQDCDLTISLKNEASPVWDYRRILRKGLRERYPGTEFTFQPADLTAKILNFGSPSPIDVRINGTEMEANYEYARRLASELRKISGASDVTIQQTMRTPTLNVNGNRSLGLGIDLTLKDITDNLLMSTSGSQQVDQVFWLDHKTGLSYQVNIYLPQPQLASINDLLTIPVDKGDMNPSGKGMQLLGNVASLSVTGTPGVVTHMDIMPVFDIYVSAEGRDLGGVLADVEKAVENMEKELPRGTQVDIKGQAETMASAYFELLAGLVAAIVLVYLLLVINFQSWLDPFIIITALPGALAGIAWSLFITHTNISVPALTGAIMSMGTATANSILVVSYARERFEVHGDALKAAVEAGYARIRPVLMTASAMIIGMLPMSLSNSQNAPLGRAVMGGLMLATFATLLFVPCVYAMIYSKRTASRKEKS